MERDEDLLALVEVTAEHPALVADAQDARAEDDRPTEWFSVDGDEEAEPEPAFARREHHVTAVIVAHDGETWLPASLTTLAGQSRPVDGVVGVDTGSSDASLARLRTSLGEERVVEVDRGTGFGAAARSGVEHIDRMVMRPDEGYPDSPAIEWIWLLHDDSAPDAGCLEALLETADRHPSAAVLGPKVLGWHDRRLLLEVGFSVTGSGRRTTGLERREHDQGQHDGVRDVMAVGSAGMLVRRDIWERLGGFDPSLPLFRDDLDFCWRAHRMGERVLVATDAVLHHREASAHGRRASTREARPHRLDREAAAHVLLAHASALAAPFLVARLLLGSALSALVALLGKDVAGARDEVAAVWAVASRPRSVSASRRLVARTSTEPAGCVRSLRPTAWSQLRQAVEALAGIVTTSGANTAGTVSALEAGPVDDEAEFLEAGAGGWVRRALIRPVTLLVLGLTVIAVIGLAGLWIGEGTLQGGALLPAPEGASDLRALFAQAWHDVAAGSSAPSPPYLMLLWPLAVVLLGKAPVAVSALFLLAVPIAGWSAYFALRGVVASRAVRVWAGAAYALLPALAGAVSSGRLGTLLAAILVPFAVRSLARIAGPQGTFRRAAGTALLVAAVMAAAPATWLLALAAGIALAAVAWRTQGRAAAPLVRRLALAVLAPLALLAPWSLRLLVEPTLFLLEPGVPLDDPVRPVDVLLLHPGGPGMTPLWASAGLLIAGALALVRRDRLRLVVVAMLAGGAALALGILQAALPVQPPTATAPIATWPGPATLLFGAALITAAAIAADGLRERFAGTSFSIGQPLAAVAVVAAIVAPLASAVTWLPRAEGELHRAPAVAVPAFVAADAAGPQSPRTLVLREDAAGSVRYSLVNGAGPVLGDADVAPDASTWAGLDPLVAALASGRGGEEVAALAGYGVRYVLVAAGTSAGLIPVLDGAPGLRRLSTADGEVLWRVAGETSRARVDGPSGTTPVDIVVAEGAVSTDPYVDAELDAGTLVLGAAGDTGWRAVAVTSDGTTQALEAVAPPEPLAWSQGFAVSQGSRVEVRFDDAARGRWLLLQVIVLLVLVVLALPSRRAAEDYDLEGPDAASDAPRASDVPDDVSASGGSSDAGNVRIVR